MTGGLIQIVSYGSQDLYLTGTPEITFFKVVYRRHTNFSIESIKVNFDETVSFGETAVLTLPKLGDLVHKAYLEIELPKIDFKRDTSSNSKFVPFDNARGDYQIVLDFMSINRRAFVNAFDIVVADNNDNTESLLQSINDVFNDVINTEVIQKFKDLLQTTSLNPPFRYNEISIQDIVNNVPLNSTIDEYFFEMEVGIDKSIKTQEFFRQDLLLKSDANDDELNENLKFAWVERVGHAIIEEIEVMIGGNKIDRQFGDWINIWYELSANRYMEETYFKMIGNISELTTFDRNIKPKYKLRIPLPFWFCRHSGLSIPLIALQYHDVTFHVKFRDIEEISYLEENTTIFVSQTSDQLFLDEVPSELGINIQACMLFDYIYLEASERRRFAQSSHEYLIEQVQILDIRDIKQASLQCTLNNFVHPSKELIWIAQKDRYIQNFNGYTKLRWDNYSLSDENIGNPILFSTIDFHNYNRVPRLEGNYFNYVQPWETHSTTPSDGINMYAFSLFPEDFQPSGTANLSRLSRVTLTLEFDESLFPDEVLSVRIYTRTFNILRFISGFASPAFTY